MKVGRRGADREEAEALEDRPAVVGCVGLQVAETGVRRPRRPLRDDGPEDALAAPVGDGRPAVQAAELGAWVELDAAHRYRAIARIGDDQSRSPGANLLEDAL